MGCGPLGSAFRRSLTKLWIASAQDVAKSRAHKNIAGADVLKALELTGFGHLAAQLEDDLEGETTVGSVEHSVLTTERSAT